MKKERSWLKAKDKNAFYGFLGYTAFSTGIVTLNPTLCCGLYGQPLPYFLTSLIILLLGAAFIVEYHG